MKYVLGFFLVGFLVLTSCNEPSELGLELIEASAFETRFVDTLDLKVEAFVQQENLMLDKPNGFGPFEELYLGKVYDPFFGISTSALYLQPVPLTNYTNLASNMSVDSLVLHMLYNTATVYGDTLSEQSFSVYRIAEDLSADSVFYHTMAVPDVEPEPLGNYTGIILPSKEIPIPGLEDTLSARMMFRLSEALEEEFKARLTTDGDSTFVESDTFVDYFKGLYIEPDTEFTSEGGAIAQFDISSSYIELYYNVDGGDQQTVRLIFTDTRISMNQYSWDVTNADQRIKDIHASGDTGVPVALTDEIYMHGLAFLGARIEIPNLVSFASSFGEEGILINRAQIELFDLHKNEIDTLYRPTPILYINSVNEEDEIDAIFVDSSTSLAPVRFEVDTMINHYGYQAYANHYTQYTVNDGGTDLDFLLRPYSSTPFPTKVELGGPERTDSLKMKLNLSFTLLDE